MRKTETHHTRDTWAGHAPGRRRPWGDGGSISVEIAILFPALLLIVTVLVQYGLWFHARSVALAAAQEGVTAAASYRTASGSGADRARTFLDPHNADTLTDIAVTQTAPAPGYVTVQVTGRAISLLPGVAGPAVSQSAEASIEQFTVAGGP
jgi:Flp pilus assembly protein TadG